MSNHTYLGQKINNNYTFYWHAILIEFQKKNETALPIII